MQLSSLRSGASVDTESLFFTVTWSVPNTSWQHQNDCRTFTLSLQSLKLFSASCHNVTFFVEAALAYIHSSYNICTYACAMWHTHILLLPDITFWMLQQFGVILWLSGWCHISLTWLKTNGVWNTSIHLDMCVIINVSALCKQMTYCVIKLVNYHN